MFKSLSFREKVLFWINIIVCLWLFFSYILMYIPPKWFDYSFLTLVTPVLLVFNAFFLLYWLLKVKIHSVMSLLVFLISIPYFNLFYNRGEKTDAEFDDLSIMTFNVRVFNHFNWNKDKTINEQIIKFLKEKHPNVIALQEFHKLENKSFGFYRYRKMIYKNEGDNIGQAILSDFPIIESGSLDFPNTGNNGVYADIAFPNDTIRLYSLHFESFHIDPEQEAKKISGENTKRIVRNINKRFATQQSQVEMLEKHIVTTENPIVVCGDFNNTPFSYLYRKIRGKNLQDSFEEAGEGFGKTFNFRYFPFRIDYILVDRRYKVTSYRVFDGVNLSDHYPVFSTIRKI